MSEFYIMTCFYSSLSPQRLSGLGYCFSASQPPMLASAAIQSLKVLEQKPRKFCCEKKVCLKVNIYSFSRKLYALTPFARYYRPICAAILLLIFFFQLSVLMDFSHKFTLHMRIPKHIFILRQLWHHL